MFGLLFFTLLGCRTEEVKVNTDTVDSRVDADNDGYDQTEDCDDNNAAIHTNATEICDGLDNNCDGSIDEGVTTVYYPDNDQDGFGGNDQSIEACSPPEGYVLTTHDCNDQNPEIYPGSERQCDEVNTTQCASGGAVEGSTVQGTFCFASTDIAAAPSASNQALTWQPGPFTKITKE